MKSKGIISRFFSRLGSGLFAVIVNVMMAVLLFIGTVVWYAGCFIFWFFVFGFAATTVIASVRSLDLMDIWLIWWLVVILSIVFTILTNVYDWDGKFISRAGGGIRRVMEKNKKYRESGSPNKS